MRTDPVFTPAPDPAMPLIFSGIVTVCAGGALNAASYTAAGGGLIAISTVLAKIDGLDFAAAMDWVADRLTPWWRQR